jgi:glycosyltransferase involved in cell wall biosynthesis
MSRVSVVIPLFNDCQEIGRSIRSALRQHELKEIIVVDDCSTDESCAVVEDIAREETVVRLLQLEKNSGPAVARNFGVAASQGEFLCFLDSDDEFLDNYFTDVISMLDANPKVHAFKVGMEYFDPVKGYILPSYDPRYIAVVFSSACNVMIRRESFLKMGGFPDDSIFRASRGGEDAAFCSALAKYLPPLGRIDKAYYRCWSYAGSHVDRFLANTRLADIQDGFEFVSLGKDQQPGGPLEQAIEKYSRKVGANLGACQQANGESGI